MDHNKAKKVARVLAIVLVAALILTSFSFVMFLPGMAAAGNYVVYAADTAGAADSDAYLEEQMAELEMLLKDIKENYKDEISYQTLVDGAFSGAFEALNDPYSVYYATTEEGDEFIDNATGEFSGVGVSMENYNGLCRIVAPLSDGPAERAGIRTGDIITKVDGVSVSGQSLSEISARLKGTEGSSVKVTVDRNGQSLDFAITRAKVKTATVFSKMMDKQVGYIQITQFGTNTHNEFRLARLKLLNEGAQSLILDIRSNPGGVMNAAADIANQMMVKSGPIFHYAQQGKIVETVSSQGSTTRAVPTVLLVNEGSASASEALAGALKDSKTAVLVGTTTYGKGVAQQYMELKSGASFKLSMYYFLTPDKHQIDHAGIAPDYAVYNGLGLTEAQLETVYSDLAPMTEKVKYKAGETGLNVYAAQQRLLYLGYDVTVNGTLDEESVAAIKEFQTEQGFSAYGGLDLTTMDALDAAFYAYIFGSDDDKQLAKAVELLTK